MGRNIGWKFAGCFCLLDRIVLFRYLNVEGTDGGSYIDRVIFCVVSRIVLVGDETLTEVVRSEVVF